MTFWVTLGDPLGNAQALVDTLADTVQETEEFSVGDSLGNAQALVDTLADTVPKMEQLSIGDTRGGAQALIDLLGDGWRHTGQCAGSGRHAGSHGA